MYSCKFKDNISLHQEIKWATFNWSIFEFSILATFGIFSALITGGIYGVVNHNSGLAWYSFIMSTAFLLPGFNVIFYAIRCAKRKFPVKEYDIKFNDDKVVINDTVNVDYAQVIRFISTKNYLLIVFRNENENRYIPVKKDACSCDSKTLISFIKIKRKESRLMPTS